MRRASIPFVAGVVCCIFLFTWFLLPSEHSPRLQDLEWPTGGAPVQLDDISEGLLHGDGIMPALGNETAKAELGRASWKLFHTMLARFPKKPTPDERQALKSYIYLFARLYPCGECGEHFRGLLKQYPPQTSSRDSASQWGCYVHNQVNVRLKKPDFDCRTVTDVYKCGCADAEDAEGGDGTKGLPPGEDLLGPLPGRGKTKDHEKKEETTQEVEVTSEMQGVHLEVEGLTRGG